MLCSYCKVTSFKENPICSIDKEYCFKTRPCTAEMTWKGFGDINKCKEIKENKSMKLFKNEYKVRFVKNNKLFIEIPISNSVITLDNPYNYEPKKVTLIKVKDKYFIEEFYKPETSKKETKK